MFDLIIIGGGAAGFFTAIQLGEQNPGAKVLIVEKSGKFLSKVKVSGGGRCNITHACYDPMELVNFYPRGKKELLGPFYQFGPTQMFEWLEQNGLPLKVEEDNRVFPASNASQSVIDLYTQLCKKYGIQTRQRTSIEDFEKTEQGWELRLSNRETLMAKNLMIATGSSTAFWKLLEKKGIDMVQPVPSLFTFNTKAKLFSDLQGLSFPDVEVQILGSKFRESGPLLVTHWGVSGPAVLKLSAIAARELSKMDHKFKVELNLIGLSKKECLAELLDLKQDEAKKKVMNQRPFGLAKRAWARVVELLGIQNKNWADLNKKDLQGITDMLCAYQFEVKGKTTFKEEFVTAGGVDLKQINFTTMEHKEHSSLYFAGEVLNIDALTGGFNFQAAWTTAYLAASHIATKPLNK